MSENPGILSQEEYDRRKQFLEQLKSLSKPECIEIVKILQRKEASFSENANGVFFNLCLLSQDTFDALELFLKFTQTNNTDLAEREKLMKSLSAPANVSAPKNV